VSSDWLVALSGMILRLNCASKKYVTKRDDF